MYLPPIVRVETTPAPHIRKRLPSRGGNGFYRARSLSPEAAERLCVTFCGAPITTNDLAWADRATKWAKANACQACIAAAHAGEA